MIELSQIGKRWPGAAVAALSDVDLTVGEGELVALLGPSGCGKSTTLRLIAGLDRPSAGRIAIAGRDVTEAPPEARGVAMVFQNYALFPHLSVRDNILFGMQVRRAPKAEQAARLAEAAALLGLSELLDRKPSALSGGQQQRVALGRAVVARRPILLMDEPLSNLDALLRQEMRRELRALQRKLGLTVVFVTHDQAEAMSMADRVVLMQAGRIVQQDAPADLYARPRCAFAARFIGAPAMNLLPLEPGPAGQVAAGTGFAPGAPPGAALFGVRPEALRPAARGLPATVEALEYLGAETLAVCRVGASPLSVRFPGADAPPPGTTLALGWDPADAHFFGPDDQRVEAATPAPFKEIASR
ncbi:ABC transporter ATP-binding protein [Rubrimonas sp.]|uniref:ABC transporter ATP-binding protein n=1 Tax=Rubrimonas sp. TaxID=2036015 RepID=UPI002FDDEE58